MRPGPCLSVPPRAQPSAAPPPHTCARGAQALQCGGRGLSPDGQRALGLGHHTGQGPVSTGTLRVVGGGSARRTPHNGLHITTEGTAGKAFQSITSSGHHPIDTEVVTRFPRARGLVSAVEPPPSALPAPPPCLTTDNGS